MNRPLVDILHAEQLSLAVETSDGTRKRYRSRGVSDLYRLLTAEPAILNRASVADKVVYNRKNEMSIFQKRNEQIFSFFASFFLLLFRPLKHQLKADFKPLKQA